MPAFGDDVASVIRELGPERVVLVGHSMGGDVIVETALRLSDRVLGLVWVDVYSRLGEPRTRAECEAFAAPFREDFTRRTLDFVRQMFPAGANPRLVDRVSADMAAAPRDVAIPALEQAIANHGPMLERLPLLAAELVAINAADGRTDVEGLRRHGIRTVPVPGVGHFPMLEDEAGFNRVLSEVLDGLGV